MDIDPEAAVVVSAERDLDVPDSTAWRVLSDIEQWHTWVPGVTQSRLDGALLPGGRFRWRSKGMGIQSVLRVVDKPHRLVWTGKSWGLRVVHVWELEPTSIATCTARTRESMDGWPTKFARSSLQSTVTESIENWIEAFRKRVRSEVPCE